MEKTFDCGCHVSVGNWQNTQDLGLKYCALHNAAPDMQRAIAHVLTTLAMGLQAGGTDKRMMAAALEASGYDKA